MATVRDSAAELPSPWLEGIEGDAAHELIESDAQVIRVVAGPGSGKTTCLKCRIQRLVQKDGIDPKTIFVGTFTRTIAGELQAALGSDIRVSTLHSLAYELLREYPDARQRMGLRFLLKFEEDTLLYDVEEVAAGLGKLYSRQRALRQLQASRAQRTEYGNAAFAGAIRSWLQRHRAMLIGEVVYLCVVGLESEDIPLGMFQHVVIDEYQDLTAVEQELVRLIWSRGGTLTVLGDDDQSIYGFRFSHPEGISDFAMDWPQGENLTFAENRRCGRAILGTANLMMAEAGSKKPPMVWKNSRVGQLNAVQWETIDDEIRGLAHYIRSHKEETFLILVPRRFIGHRLADAIGDEARTSFAEEVLEHPMAQESFITASLLANPEDFVAVRTYLGFHGTKHEHAPRYNSDAYASLPTNIGGHELVQQIASGNIAVSGTGQKNVKKRAEKAAQLIARSLQPNELVDLLFDEGLAADEPDDEKRQWLTEDLSELRKAAHELLAAQPEPDLARVISTLRYRIATRAPLLLSEEEEPRVKIMTLHSAKGIEADNVVVAGVADQFMPSIETASEIIAEQRRLFYVAVTRARDSLILSWPRRIRTSDLQKNRGRTDKVVTKDGIKWGITSRSTLLPQGLSGVIRGEQLLNTRGP